MWGGEKDRQSWSFREFLLRPPGKVFLVGLVVFALFTLWIYSVPIVGFPWFLLVPALWLIVALLWALRVTAYNFLLMKSGARPLPGSARRWWIGPGVAALTVVLLVFDVPVRVRFALSRGALERAAREVLASPQYSPDWRSDEYLLIGSYAIDHRDVIPNGVRLWVEGMGFHGFGGFAWAPRGIPPNGPGGEYRPLDRDWYEFTATYGYGDD